MTRQTLTYIILFLVLIPAQALIFNNMVLFNVAIPFVYIMLFLRLPLSMGVNWVLTIAFLSGLTVDIFSDTQGMNALAATVTAFLRRPVARLYLGSETDTEGLKPSSLYFGSATFIKYALTLCVIYCTVVFTTEAFQFFNIRLLLLRIACSAVFTFMLIYAFDSLTLSQKKK